MGIKKFALLDVDGNLMLSRDILSKISKDLAKTMVEENFYNNEKKLSQSFIDLSNNNPYLQTHHHCSLLFEKVIVPFHPGLKLNDDLSKKIFKILIEKQKESEKNHTKPVNLGVETVSQIEFNGYKTYFVTNGNPIKQKRKLILAGYDKAINAPLNERLIVFYDIRKPRMQAYNIALKKANANPKQAIFNGDKWVEDYIGPTIFGIFSIKTDQGAHSKKTFEQDYYDKKHLLPKTDYETLERICHPIQKIKSFCEIINYLPRK